MINHRLTVLLLAAQAFAQSQFPQASGPYGPNPVGRPGWRVPTIFYLPRFLNWKVGGAADAFTGLTFFEAVVRIDKSELAFIEGSDQQWVSPEIRKNLDYRLTPEEINAVKARLQKFRLQMPVYHVERFEDQVASRKVFEFAKSLAVEKSFTVETIVCGVAPRSLAEIDQLANEFGINVAVPAGTSLEERSRRIGFRVESPEQVAQFRDRVMVVRMRDPQAFQKEVMDMYRLDVKPVFFSLMSAGGYDAAAGLARSVDAFEQIVLPAFGDYMIRRSKTLPVRGPAELPDDVKQKIRAAIPKSGSKTAKPRRLLVMDQRMFHAPIPHANYALDLMGKSTGAFEVIFSNDLDNLKYDKIRQFDAVMFNSTECDISTDPGVREGLLRFVRGGGGVGGIHAASWSFAFWPEFMEMFGGSQGPHRTEPATLKIDDPVNPITAAFEGQPFTLTDEYYRMTDTGLQGIYYSRDKVHVLLSIDPAKSPGFLEGRVPFQRKDNDYAVAWIKGYGKGRVFYTCLGHTPDMFYDSKMNRFLLAAVQFTLGDVAADTTPSSDVGGVK
jgi:type 1 glutamine amidotransferase